MDDRFNLRGVQCSTGIHTPLVIVNGPIARELNINGSYNCFGQGWRANATIGRAIKLILVNLGGAIPGETNKATLGHPGAYTYCIAENEEASPWEPFHVELGYSPADSIVTVFPGEAPHNIMYSSGNPRDLLTVIADTMCPLGNVQMYVMGDTFLALGPEHARILSQDGWRKRDIKQYLFEHARKPVGLLRPRRSSTGRPTTRNALAQIRRPIRRRPDGPRRAPPRRHIYNRSRWSRRSPLCLPARLGFPNGPQENRSYMRSYLW